MRVILVMLTCLILSSCSLFESNLETYNKIITEAYDRYKQSLEFKPTINDIYITKDYGIVGQRLQIKCYAEDKNFDQLYYEWLFTSGTADSLNEQALDWVPSQSGTFAVNVLVSDTKDFQSDHTVGTFIILKAINDPYKIKTYDVPVRYVRRKRQYEILPSTTRRGPIGSWAPSEGQEVDPWSVKN